MIAPLHLHVTEETVAALDRMCELRFADSHEEMAAIWLDRWGRNHIDPGDARSEPKTATITVVVKAPTMKALRIYATRAGAQARPEAVAMAVVNGHGRHVAANIRRKDLSLEDVPPVACWCVPRLRKM